MPDILYDIETKELIDQNALDPDAAIRTMHMSIGVAWCECHDAQTFHNTAELAAHLLSHTRIIGFNIIHFDNAVLAWSEARAQAALRTEWGRLLRREVQPGSSNQSRLWFSVAVLDSIRRRWRGSASSCTGAVSGSAQTIVNSCNAKHNLRGFAKPRRFVFRPA